MPYHSSPLIDDSPAITTAVNLCGPNATILFQPNVTYNLLTPLSFTNLSRVNFLFEGNVSLSDNVTVVQQVVDNTRVYRERWITVKGVDVGFEGRGGGGGRGMRLLGGGLIGLGLRWCIGLTIRNIKVLNPVAWVFSIGGSDVEMRDILIDARSSDGFPFNTGMEPFANIVSDRDNEDVKYEEWIPSDGIDLSASNVLIDGLEIHNGDDIINISPPATNVTVIQHYPSYSSIKIQY
ncbi:glycoside hydrolase family 28 protein [Sclerotinia borealis F-4128]|uniref:Glycoside hydrolase family 28 protein n=1 Tax=Sclerotinia borealis (strain F-4128) TaxID=1432307 RepID=W9CBB4_SCLBF|nr:glycoside hydrolase family 28 protein [Sclerotinia borealis F-4128]